MSKLNKDKVIGIIKDTDGNYHMIIKHYDEANRLAWTKKTDAIICTGEFLNQIDNFIRMNQEN